MNRRFVVAYDITSNRTRRRVAALLEGHGLRIQRSVFIVESSQHELVQLLRRLQLEPMTDTDHVAAYPVVQNSALTPSWQARQQAARVPAYWVL